MRNNDILKVIIVLVLFMSVSALVGIRHWRGAQAGTAAKSAFLDAGGVVETPSPHKPSFARSGIHDAGFSLGKDGLIFIARGEEIFRIYASGQISGENGRHIGMLNEREVDKLLDVMGR